MKMYGRNTKIGDAGEMYLGFHVIHKLNFIYRAQKLVDIGIDGEIEMLTEKYVSTGNLVKVQVKTTDIPIEKWDWKVTVSKKDIAYWKLLSIPVILVAVILGSQQCYFRLIDDTIIVKEDSNIDMDINFEDGSIDMQNIELAKSSLSKLGYTSSGDKIILEHMYFLLNKANKIPEYGDQRLLADDHFYVMAEELKAEMALLTPIFKRLPSLVSTSSIIINRIANEIDSRCTGAIKYMDRERD
jgi:hypothetical protein